MDFILDITIKLLMFIYIYIAIILYLQDLQENHKELELQNNETSYLLFD